MIKNSAHNENSKKLPPGRRKAVSFSQKEWIKLELLQPGKFLPLVIKPALDGVNLVDWAKNNRDFIENQLLKHGGILFRNFKIQSASEFEQFIVASAGQVIEYTERSSPRTQVSGNIYTSTDHPPDQSIFLHNEQSYNLTFPLKIFFFCLTPARQGGETPVADVRRVLARISPKTTESFIAKKVRYVRNLGGDGIGLSWQTAFQTEDRTVVEEYCHTNKIHFEWRDGDRLRSWQIRDAVATHPRTHEMVWFNHATFFHVSTLEATMREGLLAGFKEEDLPNNTYYGDGSPIEPFVLDELRNAYMQERVGFPWQRGDILMLDNMLTAHSRAPFVGPRKILVAMAEPFTRTDI